MTARRDAESGLTLIEILVVLVIMAIMAGVAALAVGALDPARRADMEATRLAERLGLAVDESLVTSAPQAMVWDSGGYRFLAWNATRREWGASGQRILAERHELSSALHLEGNSTQAVVISPDLAPSQPIALRITGGATIWQVSFDGFAAAVSALGP